MDPRRSFAVIAVAAMMAAAASVAAGDSSADEKECTDQLVGLSPCLPYAQEHATASSPTPECCSALKTVLQTSRKCLCVLVKDSNDPSLDLKLDVDKALGLPAACNAPANISECPKLLDLPPNSMEAHVFEQYAKQEAAHGPAANATGGAGAGAKNGTATTPAAKSGAAAAAVGPAMTLVRWLGARGARAGVLSSVLSAAAPLAVPFLLLLA